MIPVRTKPAVDRIQLNRTFDSIDEMNVWLTANMPEAVVVKTWSVKTIACEVEIPEYRRKKK